MKFVYISRITTDEREQPTVQHLSDTACYASMLAKKINIPEIARLTALLHDMGKYSTTFVKYLRENDKSKRGSVIFLKCGMVLMT